jgi:hypothetical protein
MTIADENWNVMASLLPAGWQEMAMALQSGAFERLREFSSPGVLLRTLLLHVARGHSLRETVVRAKPAHLADVSDVALLKRFRKSENWLRSLCVELLQENCVNWCEEAARPQIRIVDGTIVKESGRTGSQWRILYSLQLPSLRCDYFDITATLGEGSGESLNRLTVHPQELILADAGYCSIAGIEHVQRRGADVLVRVNPQSFVAYSRTADEFLCYRDCELCQKRGNMANGELSCIVKTPRLWADCARCERAPARFNKPTDACIGGRARSR